MKTHTHTHVHTQLGVYKARTRERNERTNTLARHSQKQQSELLFVHTPQHTSIIMANCACLICVCVCVCVCMLRAGATGALGFAVAPAMRRGMCDLRQSPVAQMEGHLIVASSRQRRLAWWHGEKKHTHVLAAFAGATDAGHCKITDRAINCVCVCVSGRLN